MKTRAAVAFAPKQPLEIVEVDLDGPKASEVLVEIMATGICHTDAYTLDGFDSEGIFPSILGHEGAGVVREVGPGVTSVKAGDHVIPLYTPECRQCKSCLSGKTNLCTAIRATQGKGVMPDGTSRFSYKGQTIFHYMGCSTFSNFTVLPEIAVAKIREDAPFKTSCYIGCGVTTGVGAVVKTAKVEPGANVVVFGLGGIGLNVIQGARLVGANKIIGNGGGDFWRCFKEHTADRPGWLARDNPLDRLRRQRLDVRPIRELGIGHDRRGIRVDEDDAIPLVAQRLAGLRS